MIQAQWEHTRERYAEIPGVAFEDGPVTHFPLTDEDVNKLGEPTVFGVPSLSVFSSLAGLTGDQAPTGHLDASPILPLNGKALLEAHRVFGKLFRDAGLTQFVGFAMSYHWRSFIMFQGMHTTHDPVENAKVRAMYKRIVDVASEHGWGIYRTHTAFMDVVMDHYSFNGHALMHLHETLKDALDPNGILSPGRYGIWPKALRRGRA